MKGPSEARSNVGSAICPFAKRATRAQAQVAYAERRMEIEILVLLILNLNQFLPPNHGIDHLPVVSAFDFGLWVVDHNVPLTLTDETLQTQLKKAKCW